MQEFITQISENISLIGAYIILGYALRQARLVTKSVMANIAKFGSDDRSKLTLSNKAVFNFYLVVAAVIVIVPASLKIIGTELFVGLLVAILTGLGIKLTADVREKPNKKDCK